MLPKAVFRSINSILRTFLLFGRELKRTTAKVSWEDVCQQMAEGGLGIKNVIIWNEAAMMKHLWNVYSKKDSLWVKWCHSYTLKGRCLWTCNTPTNSSWTWLKLMKLWGKARKLIKYVIGNGCYTFLWHDNWHPYGPLLLRYGTRILRYTSLTESSKVKM